MRDIDLAWLAGIWDGEGSISFFSHKEKSNVIKLCPTVNVVNTDIAIINSVRKLLEEMGCYFTFQEISPKNSRHSKRYDLITRNQKYIVIFLENILPYLRSIKKEKAELLLSYCKRRVERCERLPSKGSTPYDQEDWNKFAEFQSIPRVTPICSSQTTREAPALG